MSIRLYAERPLLRGAYAAHEPAQRQGHGNAGPEFPEEVHVVSSHDLRLQDGRVLRVHDSAEEGAADAFTILWHHGSPQTGALLAPLLAAAAERGIRLLSYGRPSYGGSTPQPGRNVASAAADLSQLADAFGLTRFAVMGASGGGPHALACAALMPERVTGVACLASLAPFDADGIDWFAGMVDDSALRAAVLGREARALRGDGRVRSRNLHRARPRHV